MNNLAMDAHFERDKNLQASGITAAVCIAVFLLFFFVQWTLPQIQKPEVNEGIEVNLGNSDFGSGDEQPLVPGEPAPESNPAPSSPPPASTAAPAEEPADHDPDGAPATTPTKVVKPETKPTPPTSAPKKAVTMPTPPAPKPKAQMNKPYTGGNGTGGNNQDSYNNSHSQGNDPSGIGDKGKMNGNPNSDSYTGNGGSGSGGGVSIRSGLGGRRFTKLPSFTDDFNENAKVAVDITVNKSGSVVSAIINPKGTTTTNANIRNIALRKARELKLNAGTDDEQAGTIVFAFKVKG